MPLFTWLACDTPAKIARDVQSCSPATATGLDWTRIEAAAREQSTDAFRLAMLASAALLLAGAAVNAAGIRDADAREVVPPAA